MAYNRQSIDSTYVLYDDLISYMLIVPSSKNAIYTQQILQFFVFFTILGWQVMISMTLLSSGSLIGITFIVYQS